MADWIILSQTSGVGDATVALSATPHTGRDSRQGSVTFSSDVGGITAPISVSQEGVVESISDLSAGATVSYLGGVATLRGVSNSSKLTFTTDDTYMTIGSTYRVGGVDIQNGGAIPNDPGAAAAYEFEVGIVLTSNIGAPLREGSIRIEGSTSAVVVSGVVTQNGAFTVLGTETDVPLLTQDGRFINLGITL